MQIYTRITTIAKERGSTAAEVARGLKLYRSNISAMDAGRRSVSLQLLSRIAEFLGCSPTDLIEVRSSHKKEPFRNRELLQRLEQRAFDIPEGSERGWVHRVLLTWQRHYRLIHKQK